MLSSLGPFFQFKTSLNFTTISFLSFSHQEPCHFFGLFSFRSANLQKTFLDGVFITTKKIFDLFYLLLFEKEKSVWQLHLTASPAVLNKLPLDFLASSIPVSSSLTRDLSKDSFSKFFQNGI